MAVYDSILDLIGNTPMVDVSAAQPQPQRPHPGQARGPEPGGSVKDRAAKAMIEEAEKDGAPDEPGQTILESSSGNTGIALAMIARVRGYQLKVVLPENVSAERRQLLEVFGAEIIPSPGAEGSNGAMRRAQALAAEHPDWCFPYQYGNPANPKAHYEGTGPEIWRDCPEVTHFVAGLGTAGTLMGVGRFLKERNPDVAGLGRRAAGRRDGRRAEELRRGLRPAGVHRQRRLRAARPQADRAAPRVDRVDPPADRGRRLRRHLVGCGHGRRRQVRRARSTRA